MILVLLGTQNNSFHRLLEEIQKNIDNGNIKEEVIVQKGYTKFESKDMKVYNQLPIDEIKKLVSKADLIITHGGVGSIIDSIEQGKKVIAVPRLKKFKEHVNDHQIDIIKSFDEMGYIIGIEDVTQLSEALERAKKFKPKEYIQNTGNIIKIVEKFIDNNWFTSIYKIHKNFTKKEKWRKIKKNDRKTEKGTFFYHFFVWKLLQKKSIIDMIRENERLCILIYK